MGVTFGYMYFSVPTSTVLLCLILLGMSPTTLRRIVSYIACLFVFGGLAAATPLYTPNSKCRKTKVAVLGAGVAGITAAVG